MKSLHKKLFVFALTLLCSSPAFSDDYQSTTMNEVVVSAEKEKKNALPDVAGTNIYSGKKTSVIDLQETPVIVNSNYRQALEKTPSLLISEETTPLVSIGYRGLTPNRAQFIQVLKDGVPISADLIGYPEAYYVPPLESVDHIEFVHGGAALLYGPQPGGALNFVTKDPYSDGPLRIVEENVGGSNGFYSNYTGLSGTQGPIGYYGYLHHRQSQGFRDNNSQYSVNYGGTKFTYQQDPSSAWKFALDTYKDMHGEPGGLTRADFDADPTKTNRLYDHFELTRTGGSLSYDKEIDPSNSLAWKTFGSAYDRYSWRQRTSASSSFGTAPSGANSTQNDIEAQRFYTGGSEVRFRHDYDGFGGDNNTFTSGVMYYHATSPRLDMRGTSPDADYGTVRRDTDRDVNYTSLFAENLFRFNKLSVTPGVRLENIWQSVRENINLDKTTVPLADHSDYKFVPLFGLGTQYELAENLDIYSNISQGYRPKIYTQAVPTGNGQTINEDLEEGKSWQTDIGLRGSPKSYFNWDASAFYMEFTDQIGTVGTTGAVVQNVGDARHYGLELASELDLIGLSDQVTEQNNAERFGALNFFTALTFLRAKFFDGPNKNRAPQYAPDYIARGGLEYDYHKKAQVRLAGTFLDDHFANDSNASNFLVPSYKVWDLTAEFNVYKDAVKVVGGINNVFDEKYYARVVNDGIDPADGRNYYGGVKVVW